MNMRDVLADARSERMGTSPMENAGGSAVRLYAAAVSGTLPPARRTLMGSTTPERRTWLSAIDVALFVTFAWIALSTVRRS
jgi:hypothetical protein